MQTAVGSASTLDAKYMNSFFASVDCDCAEYRVGECEADKQLMSGTHRYLSFIRERVLRGVRMVQVGEECVWSGGVRRSLMSDPRVCEGWRDDVEAILQPIEDVREGDGGET